VLDGLAGLRQSMSTILRFHYFITKDMRADLNRAQMGGTVPLLYIFLARMGCTVLDTSYVSTPAPGVKIDFRHGAASRQTLYYFKTDLSNGGGSAGFLNWCAAQGPGAPRKRVLSRSTPAASAVRSFLLEQPLIVQDGRHPAARLHQGWTVHHCGRYLPHGEMFGKYYQRDLASLANPPPSSLRLRVSLAGSRGCCWRRGVWSASGSSTFRPTSARSVSPHQGGT
jgi:hypothetical protein